MYVAVNEFSAIISPNAMVVESFKMRVLLTNASWHITCKQIATNKVTDLVLWLKHTVSRWPINIIYLVSVYCWIIL